MNTCCEFGVCLSGSFLEKLIVFVGFVKFQKYALESLQQLLADHPPAPVGQDPDEGTVPRVTFLTICFLPFFTICFHDTILLHS